MNIRASGRVVVQRGVPPDVAPHVVPLNVVLGRREQLSRTAVHSDLDLGSTGLLGANVLPGRRARAGQCQFKMLLSRNGKEIKKYPLGNRSNDISIWR